MRTVQKIDESMKALLTEMGIAEEAMEEFVETWEKATAAIVSSPRDELLWRLNARVNGEDPGPSVNWPGERGLWS